jgi:hemerythrin superfamily protein
MNAISLLKADHRAVEELFDKLDQLDGTARGKKSLVEKIIRELSIHSSIEEQVFYPEVKKTVPGAAEMVLESLEEHSVVKWELLALESMDVTDERFDAKIKVLRDTVMHHVEEEEGHLFPKVRDALSVAQLSELGAALERARKTAPTRPHPRAPNEPPGNVIANIGASVLDRARDAGRALMRSRTHVARREKAAGGKREAASKKGARATARRAPASRSE